MRCSELMKQDVERCLDGSLVTEAASAMRDRNVGFLPVCNDDGVAVGTITDRDIVVRVLAEGRAPDGTRIDEIMTHEVVSCSPDDELGLAEDLMMRFQKSRMVCTDESRRIAGVISLSDIAKLDVNAHAGTVAASVATREAAVRADVPHARVRRTSCREIMRLDVARCSPDDVVRTVAETMRRANVGFVPVCDADGSLVGVVTDRDLVLRVVAAGLDPETTRIEEVLTKEIVSCSPDDPLGVAEDRMARHRKSRIVCMDDRQRLAGVVSLSDVARVERFRRVARVLRDVSTRPVMAA